MRISIWQTDGMLTTLEQSVSSAERFSLWNQPPLYLISKCMNTIHHPDQERCKKLTEIGFPDTDYSLHTNRTFSEMVEILPNPYKHYKGIEWVYVCPSVMELLDVIPKTYKGWYFFEMYHNSCRIKRIDPNSPTWWDVMYNAWEKWQSLPNALCDLIFWLYDNKYITFPTHE